MTDPAAGERWAVLIEAGVVTCTQCERSIEPGEDWVLDGDAPRHRTCPRRRRRRLS